MLNKFLNGLVFGAGFAIAFLAIWTIGLSYVVPTVLENVTNRSPDMAGGTETTVVPIEKGRKSVKSFTLHKRLEEERKIPVGGGMLSIAVLDGDSGKSRPSTFQAWVTETDAFAIKTEGDIPTIKKASYPKANVVDYAGTLVHDNVGFQKQNMTMPISESEVRRLKSGMASSRDDFLNGQLRITPEGVVFLLPNEYEHNNQVNKDVNSQR